MKILATTGREELAIVYIMELDSGHVVECVESLQPPFAREQKWVLLVSTMFGCPVGCQMCDAGGFYQGKPTKEEIFAQTDFLVQRHYPDGFIPARQFKIQFARMGEPALNPAVLDVLDELPPRYRAPGLMPSVSTVAPAGRDDFFERLLAIKQEKYAQGRFQFQFSLHTTDLAARDRIIPIKKWGFERMAAYGERFFASGDRKVTLNFALAQGMPLDPQVLLSYFDPHKFLVKITPLNPTYRAVENHLASYVHPGQDRHVELVSDLNRAGYDVILSIGELEENFIGSNCGQFLRTHLAAKEPIQAGYTYQLQEY